MVIFGLPLILEQIFFFNYIFSEQFICVSRELIFAWKGVIKIFLDILFHEWNIESWSINMACFK